MNRIKRTLAIAMTTLLLSAGTVAHAQKPQDLETMQQFMNIMTGYFNIIESSHQFASDAEKSAILQMYKIQEVYDERGEKARAAEIFREVIENSQNPTIRNAAFVLLGDLLKETGRTDEAVTVLRKGLAENLRNAN
ncbi:MAG: tetratricopeptide repeat protein [Gammaproteobacteria bacterium]